MSVKFQPAGRVTMAHEAKDESAQVDIQRAGSSTEAVLPNGQRIAVRLMDPSDREQILAFARSLPPDDLLFLRTDITQPAIVDQWIADLERGDAITVVAETQGKLAGYATLHL